ncbi:MAG: type II toxin-antitoxin system ParD family antitoxin [Candidatus Thiodiazotropha sp.]
MASGRYGSTSEVVRDALREMEEQNSRIAALQSCFGKAEMHVR